MAELHFACHISDVPQNGAKIVAIKRHSIGIFKLSDGYFAMLNVCPHRGAAICQGPVCGTTGTTQTRDFVYERSGEIVRCAWHGWEFDIRTGHFLVDPKVRARTFPVTIENDNVFVQC